MTENSEKRMCFVKAHFVEQITAGKSYTYKAFLTKDQYDRVNSATGMHAVVKDRSDRYQIVLLTSAALVDPEGVSDCKYIVQIIDPTEHEELMAKQARAKAIRAELLEKKRKKLEEIELSSLFDGDEEAQKLIAELKALG